MKIRFEGGADDIGDCEVFGVSICIQAIVQILRQPYLAPRRPPMTRSARSPEIRSAPSGHAMSHHERRKIVRVGERPRPECGSELLEFAPFRCVCEGAVAGFFFLSQCVSHDSFSHSVCPAS